MEPETVATAQGRMFDEHQKSELAEVGITVESQGAALQLTNSLFLRKFKLSDSDLGISNREVR